jgi:stringent starvation protein B
VTDASGTTPPLTPKRPYLLRALHQWMTDNGQTPHIVVDATVTGVQVPVEHVKDGRITLNVSYSATGHLDLGLDAVSFEARFGGVARRIRVPLAAVVGIYARESGEGLVFPPDEYGAAPPPATPPDAPPPPTPGRPSLKVVR